MVYNFTNIDKTNNYLPPQTIGNDIYICYIPQVILSLATHLYFDHPYEPDPAERGYYWATRYTDTRKSFGFIPGNVYANADVKRNGSPLSHEDICGGDTCYQLTKPENIIGTELFII